MENGYSRAEYNWINDQFLKICKIRRVYGSDRPSRAIEWRLTFIFLLRIRTNRTTTYHVCIVSYKFSFHIDSVVCGTCVDKGREGALRAVVFQFCDTQEIENARKHEYTFPSRIVWCGLVLNRSKTGAKSTCLLNAVGELWRVQTDTFHTVCYGQNCRMPPLQSTRRQNIFANCNFFSLGTHIITSWL